MRDSSGSLRPSATRRAAVVDGRPLIAETRASRSEDLLLLRVELFLRQHALILELGKLLQLLDGIGGKPVVLGGGLDLFELGLGFVPFLGLLSHVVGRTTDSGRAEQGTSASEHAILLGAGAN